METHQAEFFTSLFRRPITSISQSSRHSFLLDITFWGFAVYRQVTSTAWWSKMWQVIFKFKSSLSLCWQSKTYHMSKWCSPLSIFWTKCQKERVISNMKLWIIDHLLAMNEKDKTLSETWRHKLNEDGFKNHTANGPRGETGKAHTTCQKLSKNSPKPYKVGALNGM